MEKGFKDLKLPYSEEIEEKFIVYRDLLKEWNKKINITSIEEDEDIYVKHFIDSLLILNEDNAAENKTIIDVGTGGGFPGLPLKIVNDNYRITLLDSLRKRIDFLAEVVKALNLKNVELIHGRAEDYGQNKKYRESYDICVSRAVAPLNVLSEYCIPFVKVGGYFAAYKSDNISQEISNSDNAIKKLGGKIKEIKEISIPGTDINRKIVIIEKIEKTNIRYPRKAGKPGKDPIK
ncbi:MAG: 16S rRNA (guanine(527)-N(7))-methyltransferase RsmG [Bacillota bacterium]|jgi:16S rRNA (guanine527-N7)-methyltransferase|nr:16S rRNA (guanine(527)-N(7))-methyltransferase RsmG [Bacillota bacterium]NLL60730.1 16S rRNA (guanine(527)-N(7))-methyltransferase RsmG [Tissierellia bacterium]